MKFRVGFTVLVALVIAALIMAEKRRVVAPVRPDPVLYFLADTQRELTRLPVAATRLSDAEEIKIGNRLAWQYDYRFTQRGPKGPAWQEMAESYLQRVGARVAAHAHRKLPYAFHFIPRAGFVNAFALPGGQVFVGEGLMELMDSEDELAAVLGHEIEHVDHYHCAERVQLEARLRKVPLGELAELPIEIFMAGYSKDQEMEADREGTRLAVWGGYSPLGALRLFETYDRLYREYVERAGSPQEELSQVAIDVLAGYFRSHPPASERIAQIKSLITDEGWGNLTRERPLEIAYIFWTLRAERELTAKHYLQAVNLARRSLELNTDQGDALRTLARAQFALADFAGAAASCRQYLERQPLDSEVAALFAYSLAADNPAQGVREYEDWFSKSKLPEALRAEREVDLAGLKLLAGNRAPADALVARAKAAPAQEASPNTLGKLGGWYYRAGNYDEAAKLLDTAVEQRPGETTFQVQLGWALIEHRRYESAQEWFNSALNSNSNAPAARMGLAVVEWQARQTDRAVGDFAVALQAEPFWLEPKWVRALYSPTVSQDVAALQAEQKKRRISQIPGR